MSASTPPPPLGSEPAGNTPTDPTPAQGPADGGGTPSRADARRDDPLRHSRTSGAYGAVILAAVLLVLLVIFVVQNTESTRIEFLGFDGSVPLAAALLIATVVGMVIVGAVSSLRILQLRRRIKREKKNGSR